MKNNIKLLKLKYSDFELQVNEIIETNLLKTLIPSKNLVMTCGNQNG